MNGNLGQSSLRKRRKARDAMQAYDRLPTPLRHWLAQAAMPWSPASARKIWVKSMNKGQTPEEALRCLAQIERRTLARDRMTCKI